MTCKHLICDVKKFDISRLSAAALRRVPGFPVKAMEMGIPYQTLISGIVHRYIEGELKSKNG